ncbi:MAG: cyclic nucleotide-binding domain-containing protein [Thermoanaerobaculia bacterium]|jgi:CRP-like cAMP-binding protein|nr:MAG: cyclic nucleotide-binding domain-containing protein [Thermoanaerobaculia bacterium]MBZ0103889.1 cyclic nucleotide-binding domain-containing protein [Thermoanaerobaculia bacterium]
MVKPAAPDDASRGKYLTEHAAGVTIFEQGAAGAEMFIIEEGDVEIFRRFAGREKVLSTLGPGDFFGEMSVLEGRPRSAGARARSACRLLPIDASTLDALLRQHPEIAVRMLRKLAGRVRRYEEEEEHAARAASAALGQDSRLDLPREPVAVEADELAGEAPAARLVHASGHVYPLRAGAAHVVGRFDPVTETSPEIDLGPLDDQRSTSRRHARVSERAGRFYLSEEVGTANGTWIGAERLATGVERELADGDTLRFGRVDLVFRRGAEG